MKQGPLIVNDPHFPVSRLSLQGLETRQRPRRHLRSSSMAKKRTNGQCHSDQRKHRRKVARAEAESVICQTILEVAKVNGIVSADDVHRVLEIPPDCMKFVAHAFRALQKRGLIRIVRIINTPRDGQHGNRIAIWEIVVCQAPNSQTEWQSFRTPSGTDSAAVNR